MTDQTSDKRRYSDAAHEAEERAKQEGRWVPQQTSAQDVAELKLDGEIAGLSEQRRQGFISATEYRDMKRAAIKAALQAERARTLPVPLNWLIEQVHFVKDTSTGGYWTDADEAHMKTLETLRALASAAPATDGGLDAAIREAQSQPGIADLERLHKVRP